MAGESPLEIYRRILERSAAMPAEYQKAADEQRGGLDTSMADITGAYAKRDPGNSLYAMGAGMLKKTAPWSFGNAFGSGLEAYVAANGQDADKDVERASKIAALRQARNKLSTDVLDQERLGLGTQTSVAGGIQGINKDNIAEGRIRAQEQRDEMLLRLIMGTGGATPPPAPTTGGDGSSGVAGGADDDILNESEGGDWGSQPPYQVAQATPQPSPQPQPRAAPQPAADGLASKLSQEQKLLIMATPPAQRAGMLANILAGKSQTETQKVEERKKIAVEQLQLQPGTPAYNQYIATGQMPQPRDATRAVSELKAIREADKEKGMYEDAERSLLEAYNLIPKAWNRTGGQTAATIGEFFGQGDDKESAVYATKQIQNILSEEAIKAMGDALTGASTDFEMKKFLELYADGSASTTRKQEALKRVIEKITRQKMLAQEQSKGLRSGEYYKPGYEPPKSPTGERGEPAGAKNAPGGSDPFAAADAILKGGAK